MSLSRFAIRAKPSSIYAADSLAAKNYIYSINAKFKYDNGRQ